MSGGDVHRDLGPVFGAGWTSAPLRSGLHGLRPVPRSRGTTSAWSGLLLSFAHARERDLEFSDVDLEVLDLRFQLPDPLLRSFEFVIGQSLAFRSALRALLLGPFVGLGGGSVKLQPD